MVPTGHESAERGTSRAHARRLAQAAGHDLASPLRKATGFLEMLAEDLEGRLSEDETQCLELVRVSIDEAALRVARLTRLGRVPGRLEAPVPVELEPLLTRVHARVSREAGSGPLRMGSLARVSGDAGLLEELFLELFDNASKYAVDAQIDISTHVVDGRVFLAFTDSGPGLDAATRARVAEPFERAVGAPAVPGAGMGLAIAGCIAEAHGGELVLEASDSGGRRVRLELPSA